MKTRHGHQRPLALYVVEELQFTYRSLHDP
jgi:hypothetical protein